MEDIKNSLKSSAPFDVDISQYKNPIKTPNGSQVTTSSVFGNTKGLEVSFLPASNRIYDDNRQYFSESSLKIGEVTISKVDENIKLRRFEVFSMMSLTPWDVLTKSISKEFALNIEPQYDEKLKEHLVLNINAGFGITKKFTPDFFVYSLGNIGFGANASKQYVYTSPKLGFIVYEVFNMKSIAEVSRVYNQVGSKTHYDKFTLDQSIFVHKNINIGFRYDFKKSSEKNINTKSIFASFLF
jgi:hypothetical protein